MIKDSARHKVGDMQWFRNQDEALAWEVAFARASAGILCCFLMILLCSGLDEDLFQRDKFADYV